jgi:hypothetical protein
MWELSFCSDVMDLKALKPVPYAPVMLTLSSLNFMIVSSLLSVPS